MTSCQHGPQLLTPRCESCQLSDLRAENAKLRAALEWYAKGEPTPEHPYKEFGCRCCVNAMKPDPYDGQLEPDWESPLGTDDVVGKLARDTLAALKRGTL